MFYLGIDVSKAKFDCCLFLDDSSGKIKTKCFSNSNKGFHQLLSWLNRFGLVAEETRALMEATSVYHEMLAQFLFDLKFQVCVANPARTRYFAQSISKLNKTDKIDSEVLARFAMTVDLHLWQPTPDNIRLLNALLDRRSSLANDLKREQNRLEKANSTLIVVPILKSIKTNIKSLTRQIQNLDTQIQNHIDQDHELKRDQKLLESIPAIAERTSLLMLVFLRAHSFEKASQAAAFVGLVPFIDNLVVLCLEKVAYLKPVHLKFDRVYIWLPLLQLGTILTLKS